MKHKGSLMSRQPFPACGEAWLPVLGQDCHLGSGAVNRPLGHSQARDFLSVERYVYTQVGL